MANDPAFLFYSSDFLTGVSDLTFEERGQYITLLCLQHQKGHLSSKAIKMNVPNATADVMSKFDQDEKGNFFNKRLEVESKKRAEHAEKQRERAINGWKKRKSESHGKRNGKATANAAALPLENENVNDNESINIDVKGIPAFEFFLSYAKENKPNISTESVRLKYEAWKVAGWKCGNPQRDIKNWKTTLLNSLPYMKEEIVKSKKRDISKL